MPAKNGFQLQRRDIELLRSVHQLRIATIDHLAELSGRSVRALWSRLHKLTERRYPASVARFMQKHVYAIGSAGFQVLIGEGCAPADLREKRIRHSLFIADIHTQLLLLTRTGPITLTRWQEGSALWDSVPGRAGEDAIPIRPDVYFILEHAGRPRERDKFHSFLEADRSTMNHDRMAAKIEGYVQRRLDARKYPGLHSFIVATVTATRARAEESGKICFP